MPFWTGSRREAWLMACHHAARAEHGPDSAKTRFYADQLEECSAITVLRRLIQRKRSEACA